MVGFGVGAPQAPFDAVWAFSAKIYGNAATYDTVRPNYNSNNGLTFYGPPDSQFTELIPFHNGNYGAIFGCAGSTGACGTNSYLTNFHAWNNTGWGLEVETILQGSNVQSESNGAGGIHLFEQPGGGVANYGIVLFSNVQTFYNQADGLKCESPDVNYVSTYPPESGYSYFNSIQGIQSWGNTGWGINATTNCTRTDITNPTLVYNSGGGMFWPVRESQVENLISKLNTGNGLDLTQVSDFGYIRIQGSSFGNSGAQLAYPISSQMSNGSVLQLSVYTTASQAISGVQPTNLWAQVSQITQSGDATAISGSPIATFSTLPSSPNNGDMIFCEDCTVATPTSCTNVTTWAACTCVYGGPGTGAYAKRINGNWLCN